MVETPYKKTPALGAGGSKWGIYGLTFTTVLVVVVITTQMLVLGAGLPAAL